MNGGFVADASAGIAWFVGTQTDNASERLLNEIESGGRCYVPGLWMFEVANALLTLTRRKKINSEQCSAARRHLGKLNFVVDDEGPRLALSKISELAEKHGLTVYDAVYLELALRRGLPLASRDAALNKAAKSSGVKTLL